MTDSLISILDGKIAAARDDLAREQRVYDSLVELKALGSGDGWQARRLADKRLRALVAMREAVTEREGNPQ